MRLRGSLFWGIVLIILAAFLLLNQQGWLKGDVLGYFWPAVIILFGIWLLVGALSRGRLAAQKQSISIPLEGGQRARIKMEHAAGKLNIQAGAAPGELLNGSFGSEVEVKSTLEADQQKVKLRSSPDFWMWVPGESMDWDIRLNGEIPLSLDIDSGASASVLDLTNLKVTELDIDTGASSTEIHLPANAGITIVDIDSGAASLNIHVPAAVAARIRVKSGVTSVNVDQARFPRLDGGFYQSEDYANAANRAEITIDTGVGSVDIR
jgi:hypothetical protein